MNDDEGQASEITAKRSNRNQQSSTTAQFKRLTSFAHVCTLLIATYIIYLCFQREFEFFTWHPLLFAIGWMCVMTEAVLILTKSNILADHISHSCRIRCHWVLQSIAIACTVVGFTIVVVNKNWKNKEHWKSWHGVFGLLSVVTALVPTCCTGLLALFHRELRGWISSKVNQLIHNVFGIICLAFGSVTMILSLYTKWFARRTNSNEGVFLLCWFVMCVPLVWTLVHPIQKAIDRLKSALRERGT